MTEAEAKEYALGAVDWGLWDTRHKCWLGNADGPLRYNDRMHARAAATIATEMFGWWIKPEILEGKPFVHVGELTAHYTGPEAIKRIEDRAPPFEQP